ncbi:YdhK family protein [Paenibacillus glufosinatiresistens]|uniref:YdhK family protein n=1 Tax=Paenibacillus glufosinatiresistens TaxID=3070657 RepID=UPI00286DBBC4|nr:YdhK family protein [Paenibacillus sp. YX.27]
MKRRMQPGKAKQAALVLGATAVLALSGCSGNGNNHNGNGGASAAPAASPAAGAHAGHSPAATDMAGMTGMAEHGTSGEIPAGLQDAASPKFPVGSQVVIKDGHMPGMKGAAATVSGAFDTTVYAISYQPTTGGERITNHKWIIQQEIENAGTEDIQPGKEITIKADHMPGMMGAKAVVDSFKHTVVYMVDYTPTTGGEPVKGHQWVTEDELEAR